VGDLGKLVERGCALCWWLGVYGTPAEVHHLRDGQGMAQRAPDDEAIPLCPEHHRGRHGLHGLGTRGFAERYGITERELLELVRSGDLWRWDDVPF
jgi:hypothetical protein